MPDLLFEIFCEEIPARMQSRAAKDLERLVVGALSDRGLLFEGVRALAGPRRLTLAVQGLLAKQPDVSEEKKGPRVGAPDRAVQGFLKSAGLNSLDQCERRNDGKGEFYLAVIHRKGRATEDVLAEILPQAIMKLTWPKSMRWPINDQWASFRWVRPLHSVIATFDGKVVPFEIAGMQSGNITQGHRFLSPGPITVKRFADYEQKLKAAHVILDGAERREIILNQIEQKTFALGLELIEDEGLLTEVTGLAEWPVVLIGTIDAAFMDLPAEILQTSMRTHQKYFALRGAKTGKLANRFALVANMETADNGAAIVAGNERVLRARLADAKFFWDQDKKRTLESRVDDLKDIVFHAKLGSQLERVERIEELAGEIAKTIGADVKKAKRAARLCKADLTTGIVGEFPELQGLMGRYYALHDREDADVADAIHDHYKPLGPSDAVPTSKVSIAVALADKLHSLFMFFGVDEKPTGSGDPFALRRAALGILRIVLENEVRIDVVHALGALWGDLHDFFVDRLKIILRGRGIGHDVIDAVFAIVRDADFLRLVRRVEALQDFLKTDDGANLLIGYKRAANILRIEEKKDKKSYRGEPKDLKEAEEKTLASALTKAKADVAKALDKEDFMGAMAVLAKLRAPVDRFFDKVTVNAEDKVLRENRLKLLSQIVDTAHQVADFSKVEG